MEHEKLQIRYRQIYGFSEDASVPEVVTELVDQGNCAAATETLFGCAPEHTPPPLFWKDRFPRWYYLLLWKGRYPELLKAMAECHYWSSGKRRGPCKSYTFTVFKEERLVIPEPTGSLMVCKLNIPDAHLIPETIWTGPRGAPKSETFRRRDNEG